MSQGYFVTGTDTGVGKTEMTLALMASLQQKNKAVHAMKPVASGAVMSVSGLNNDDARRLQAQASTQLPYPMINPFAYEQPVAPHIEAQRSGIKIDLDRIKRNFDEIRGLSDYAFMEGVGGWQVPINKHQTMADIVKYINLPVILVVGMRLGCINHALLSYQAVKQSRLNCVAWIANTIDPDMVAIQENYEAIRDRLDCPCIGAIPYLATPDTAQIANLLNTEVLMR